MKRVTDPDDLNRCRSTASGGGQCLNKSIEGSDFCLSHGGREKRNKEMIDYLTEQFERRLKIDVDADSEVKLLRENLMRLNMMLAARTNLIKDEASMLAHSGSIADLLMKAEKVTVSLNRLAISSGLLLAKPALITWGQQIVAAVASMVEDKYDGWEDDLHDLAETVGGIIVQAQNVEEEK